MIPKLDSKQQNTFLFLKENDWVTGSRYASSNRQWAVLEELHTMGLAVRRETNGAIEYRRATQKEIIDHYQKFQKASS